LGDVAKLVADVEKNRWDVYVPWALYSVVAGHALGAAAREELLLLRQ